MGGRIGLGGVGDRVGWEESAIWVVMGYVGTVVMLVLVGEGLCCF